MIAMIGTSDRLCWLAETCKILLLLLQQILSASPLVHGVPQGTHVKLDPQTQ